MTVNRDNKQPSTSHVPGGAPQTAMGAAFEYAQQPHVSQTTPVQQERAAMSNQSQAHHTSATPSGIENLASFQRYNKPPLAALPVEEAVRKFTEESRKIAAIVNEGGTYRMDILTLSSEQSSRQLFCSAVIVTVRTSAQPDAALAFHTLLLADTGPDPAPYSVALPGNLGNVEVRRTPGDAYDDDYRMAIFDKLRETYPSIPPALQFDAEAEVVPKGYNYADTNLVRATLVNAATAAATMLNAQDKDFVDTTLVSREMASKFRMQVRHSFGQGNTVNSVGEPVRADVRVELAEIKSGTTTSVRAGQSAPSLNAGGGLVTLSDTQGFIELVWAPAGPIAQVNPFMAQQQQPQSLTRYIARNVITQVNFQKITTLPAYLLALAAVYSLNFGRAWRRSFPKIIGNDYNIRDIGAIGVDLNFENDPSGFGRPIDTRQDSFTEERRHQFMDAFIAPTMAVSIDVEEVGSQTWCSSVWLAAARGHEGAQQAILDAANLLSAGEFGKRWDPSKRPVISDNNRVHLGYYVQGGERLDLRNFDYLAALNHWGVNDPKKVRAYSDTITRVDYPIEQRLDERLQLLSNALVDLRLTGYAQRVSITGEFLNKLVESIAACGLNMPVVNGQSDMMQESRGQATWLRDALPGMVNNNMFMRQFPQPQAAGQHYGAFGRWSA